VTVPAQRPRRLAFLVLGFHERMFSFAPDRNGDCRIPPGRVELPSPP
jgi:hypothetical protein